jgi:tetratricopeptide (TPR) repeat protein
MGRGVALNQAGWVVLIIGLAFLVYEPALSAGFIWDDGRAITNNPALQSLGGLWEIWTGQAEPDYFPVKSTVLWLLYQLFGARTSPYHVVNIGVHAANAVLIWRVLRRLSIPGAWLAGLIFLVHPTHVESVAWVSECKNTFSTLFGLLSLLAWFQYQRDQRGGKYVGSLVLFVCGLLCKTHLVILPFVLLLCSWWQREPSHGSSDSIDAERERRLMRMINLIVGGLGILAGIVACLQIASARRSPTAGSGSAVGLFRPGHVPAAFWLVAALCLIAGTLGVLASLWAHRFLRSRSLPRALAFFQLAVVLGATTIWFQHGSAIGEYQLPVGGVPSRLANAGKATWWYLFKAVSPVIVWYEMPDRPVESEPEAQAVIAGTRAANPAPTWPLGKLTTWPLITIYPRWRVTPPVWYDFLPAAAIAALFGWVAIRRNGRGRGAFFALGYFLIALAPVVGLLKMSYMRAAWVADHFQYLADIGIIALGCAAGALLWRRASSSGRWLVAGTATVLIGGYSMCTFARAADYESEYTLWTDTVLKNPDAWQAQGRLGAALLARGDVRAAAIHFAQGVRLKPDDPDGHNNLGLALVSQGQVEEAIAQYRASIHLKDAQFFAHANLADALAKQGLYAEAIIEYRAAVRWNPTLVPLLFRLGSVLLETGKIDEAIAWLEKANTLAPNQPEINATLARALSLRGSSLEHVHP